MGRYTDVDGSLFSNLENEEVGVARWGGWGFVDRWWLARQQSRGMYFTRRLAVAISGFLVKKIK